jgi:hypothetical protein
MQYAIAIAPESRVARTVRRLVSILSDRLARRISGQIVYPPKHLSDHMLRDMGIEREPSREWGAMRRDHVLTCMGASLLEPYALLARSLTS